MRTNKSKGATTLALAAAIFATGCGENATDDVSESHLGILCQCYEQYRTRNRGSSPSSAEDLRSFASAQLSRAGVSSFEELLTSERDGQALTLRFGSDVIQTENGEMIGYEAQGKDGMRLVGYSAGYVVDLAEAEFAKLIPVP